MKPAFVLSALAVAFILTVLLTGCAGTVIPKNVAGTVPLAKGTGFLHWLYAPDRTTVVGAAFNATGYANYNYYLATYGAELKPPRTKDYAVTVNGAEYDLTSDACIDYGQMGGWDRSNEHPKKTLIQKAAAEVGL